MKKFMIIIGLCLIQTACSTQAPQSGERRVLLHFDDLAAEMTIRHETGATATASSQAKDAVAMDPS